jgi:hypothetical protein
LKNGDSEPEKYENIYFYNCFMNVQYVSLNMITFGHGSFQNTDDCFY